MNKFIKSQNGNAYIWAAFIVLIICMLILTVYNAISIYISYSDAHNELQRTTQITVNQTLKNSDVRDLVFEVTQVGVDIFYENLEEAGYEKQNNDYVRVDDGDKKYVIEDIELVFDEDYMKVHAYFALPLIWKMENISTIRLPVKVISRIYYHI